MNLLYKYKNGNHYTEIYDDGTRIRETIDPEADHFIYEFPESFDCKITDYCDAGCPFCHENSTIKGAHGDLHCLDPFISSLQAGTEIAVGGGNLLSHPDLEWFFTRLDEQGVIINITINQRHVRQYWNKLNRILPRVKGIGISMSDSTNDEDFKRIDELGGNVVIHTIAGILEEKDYERLLGRKILILGYKDLRRGHDNLIRNGDMIRKNLEELKTNLPQLRNICKVISFDCLGIEQINPKQVFGIPDKTYDTLYQGHDYDLFDKDGNLTVGTMYMDVVNMKVSRSSTSDMDKRYSFTGNENIAELLMLTTKGYIHG